VSGNPRVGILLAQSRWHDLVEQTQLVERLGFSHVWLGDMYVNPVEESDWLDAWSSLTGYGWVPW
jgi:alkanesulfonate monooxygenase SsuD/methylene tetrahydromethanopterin reductase-like flavin-dependent oxidoreductase (luciferase family)